MSYETAYVLGAIAGSLLDPLLIIPVAILAWFSRAWWISALGIVLIVGIRERLIVWLKGIVVWGPADDLAIVSALVAATLCYFAVRLIRSRWRGSRSNQIPEAK